ncbi:hypothetical protein M9H77_26773 [Catharanthus roseus]|uniref:Uncharacterized protein n=1 Tax=Catharanthus roseus TaxID=4058 RepID=A0ACC0ACI1_CATRO|nr:hypothetical protein M9H77_26773 [Catharanthus roseus]
MENEGSLVYNIYKTDISSTSFILNGSLDLSWKALHQNFLFYHFPFKEIFWKHDLEKERVSTSEDFYEIYLWVGSVYLKMHCLEPMFNGLRKRFDGFLENPIDLLFPYFIDEQSLAWTFGEHHCPCEFIVRDSMKMILMRGSNH